MEMFEMPKRNQTNIRYENRLFLIFYLFFNFYFTRFFEFFLLISFKQTFLIIFLRNFLTIFHKLLKNSLHFQKKLFENFLKLFQKLGPATSSIVVEFTVLRHSQYSKDFIQPRFCRFSHLEYGFTTDIFSYLLLSLLLWYSLY